MRDTSWMPFTAMIAGICCCAGSFGTHPILMFVGIALIAYASTSTRWNG